MSPAVQVICSSPFAEQITLKFSIDFESIIRIDNRDVLAC